MKRAVIAVFIVVIIIAVVLFMTLNNKQTPAIESKTTAVSLEESLYDCGVMRESSYVTTSYPEIIDDKTVRCFDSYFDACQNTTMKINFNEFKGQMNLVQLEDGFCKFTIETSKETRNCMVLTRLYSGEHRVPAILIDLALTFVEDQERIFCE